MTSNLNTMDDNDGVNRTMTFTKPLPKQRCKRCDYEWRPRSLSIPKSCPRCHSYHWTKPSAFKLTAVNTKETP